MQNVTQAWKNNQNEPLVSESFVDINLSLTDPEAVADATAKDNGSIYISNTARTVSEVAKQIEPCVTLEPNLWLLNDGGTIIPQGDNVLPKNAKLTSCTLSGGIYTRTANVYDSILRLDEWMPQPGKTYTIVIDILDDVITPTKYLILSSDTRFAFQSATHQLKYGLNYITVQTRDNITSDMLGSVWITGPNVLPKFRFKLSIVEHSDYGDCGYIGNTLSDEKGNFTTQPIVTVDFSKKHSNVIQGVTVKWGTGCGEYPVDFTVNVYNGDSIIATKVVTDNTDIRTVLYMDIVDYDRITIGVSKWCLPYRRARIEEIIIGVEIAYSKKELFSFSHSQEVDPISATLPKSEISLSVDNTDNSYNPNNPDSFANYLMERQAISAKYGYKIGSRVEYIKCGTFYMSEWNAPQNGMTANFIARDILEFMTNTYYRGVYNTNGVSLYDLALDVLLDANLPLNNDGSVNWEIDDVLKNVYTVAPLPLDTHANCLQLIANAGECVIYQDRKGVLRIERIPSKETDYSINLFNSYSKSEITLSKPLKQVDVSLYSYSIDKNSSQLYKNTIVVNGTADVVITYSGMATDVTSTVTGGTVNSATYYTNACVLNITGTGDITIEVNGKLLNSSFVTVTNMSGEKGETISIDNMLITNQDRAIAIGRWVENYMKNRMILNSDWRADPRLDALDIVDNENEYNTNKVLMTSVNYSYNGIFKGTGEGRVI